MENLKITSIEDLKQVVEGEVVELPPFSENVPFVARLKRPSLMSMIKCGKFPNSLLKTANGLFEGGAQEALDVLDDEESVKSLFDVMEIICAESFIEPSYQKMKEIGVELTDEQMMFVFNYSQNGIRALDSFR